MRLSALAYTCRRRSANAYYAPGYGIHMNDTPKVQK